MARRHVRWLVLFMLLFSSIALAQETSEVVPSIYLDQSREFLFRVSWDWPRGLRSQYRVTVGEQTLSPELLADYDILILPASSGTVEYSPEEIEAIKDYLEAGGGVLLCNPGYTPSTPATKLLMNLGLLTLRFSINKATGELRTPAGEPLGVEAWGGNTINILANRMPEGFSVGVVDAQDRPVLLTGTLGQGRFAMVSDDAVLFINNGRELTPGGVELLQWLGEHRIGKNQGYVAQRLYPELTLTHGEITVHYSQVLKDYVELIIEHADEIFEFLEDYHGHALSQMRVVLLACAGSGYAAGGEVGIGVLGERANVIEVMGHELTHEWVRPAILPSTMNEAWAIIMGLRVTNLVGFAEHYEEEMARLKNAYENAKTLGVNMDLRLTKEETGDHWFGFIGKVLQLVETAEAMYGDHFSRDFFTLAIQRIQEGKAHSPLTIRDIANVAGEVLNMDPEVIYERLQGGH